MILRVLKLRTETCQLHPFHKHHLFGKFGKPNLQTHFQLWIIENSCYKLIAYRVNESFVKVNE